MKLASPVRLSVKNLTIRWPICEAPAFQRGCHGEKEKAVAYMGQKVNTVTVMKDQQSTLRAHRVTVMLECKSGDARKASRKK